jgi:hypothetical protein
MFSNNQIYFTQSIGLNTPYFSLQQKRQLAKVYFTPLMTQLQKKNDLHLAKIPTFSR